MSVDTLGSDDRWCFTDGFSRRWILVALTAVTFAGLAVLPVHAATSDTYETGVAQAHQLYRSGEPWIAS